MHASDAPPGTVPDESLLRQNSRHCGPADEVRGVRGQQLGVDGGGGGWWECRAWTVGGAGQSKAIIGDVEFTFAFIYAMLSSMGVGALKKMETRWKRREEEGEKGRRGAKTTVFGQHQRF